jgi:hypothetical protein
MPTRSTTARIVQPMVLALSLICPFQARCEVPSWGVGLYVGTYYDTEPASVLSENTKFFKQHLFALHARKTIWRSSNWPLAVELDGLIGHHYGLVSLNEFGLAPVVRWAGFPWQEALPTYLRLAPLGVSYTTSVSPLERGPTGKGSRTLNLLFIEVGVSIPSERSEDIFVRLHHRCTIYDLLNDYGANGIDFLTLGYRYNF